MKKLFPIALVAVAAMTFTSCKKDYTCTCTGTGGYTATASFTIHDTKSNATSTCEKGSVSVTSGSTTVGQTCAIK